MVLEALPHPLPGFLEHSETILKAAGYHSSPSSLPNLSSFFVVEATSTAVPVGGFLTVRTRVSCSYGIVCNKQRRCGIFNYALL